MKINALTEYKIPNKKIKKGLMIQRIWTQRYLLFMSVPFIIWTVIFKYLPLWGWTMAFQNYKPSRSFFEQEWTSLENFITLFGEGDFYLALRNTLAMSLMGLVFGFIFPVTFALMLNEVRSTRFKRSIQTVSYLPHFISWVIAASMITQLLSIDGGLINSMLMTMGIIDEPFQFMAKPKIFWWLVTAADIWKETGWNSIIYISAMAGIDLTLYEAAKVDGASRLRRIWHITLPGIKPTLSVILIMNIGWLLSIGFERQMLLGNALVQSHAMVLDYYALKYGISLGRYSYGTAIGMFKSVISVFLLIFANKLAKKFGDGQVI